MQFGRVALPLLVDAVVDMAFNYSAVPCTLAFFMRGVQWRTRR